MLAVLHPRQLELDSVERIGIRRGESLLERAGIVGGIVPRRQRNDVHLEPALGRELHAAQRRVLAGRVGVEAEVQPVGQARELPQLVLGQRRPHRRHHRLEARLP